MQYQWFVAGSGFFDWVLLSIALFAISGKLGWKKRWMAWIPGLRIYCLGDSVGMSREGMYCGIMDFLFVDSVIANFLLKGEARVGTLGYLIHLVLFIFLFIYRLRIYMQILKLFNLSKSWIILWLIANWLPLFIIGVGKKYQPDKAMLLEVTGKAEGEKGTEPALTASLNECVPYTDEGLSIHLKERNVTDFGKTHTLLRDVALNIPPKSLVLLLGGSGAGKTTLINAVIGYEQADAKILLNGVDVYEDYESVKHKIGFVPQKNLIRGQDTVINTVGDAAEMRLPTSVSKEKREQIIKEDMDLLGLTSGQDGLVSKKSGGQLRRICIAMELVTDPALFILDEPDSGLDGVISREIFSKLRQIADEGRIVIVITHTPDRVIDLFDKVIVLAKDSGKTGRLAFYGSPEEAKEFFGKGSMEQIVMSVNSKEEGGEGRADELVEKYRALVASKKGGQAS
ncbi:MAG: ABC transporter ATP-binding protein [Lachnospiraceae bacterium]|nr:ABC transporter ATP-binding protein [Lachnospiraceae bacterium]